MQTKVRLRFFVNKQIWFGLSAESTREKLVLKDARSFSWNIHCGRWAPIKPVHKLFIMGFR